jgi:hypothetical protein
MSKNRSQRKTRRLTQGPTRGLRKTGKRLKPHGRKRYQIIKRSGLIIKRPHRISDKRLEKGLRILNDTGDFSVAARAIRVSPKKFKRTAKRKGLIHKRNGRWKVVAALPRRIAIFTEGKQLAITVRSKTSSLIGKYNSAVGQFLRTNKLQVLSEFKGVTVKDINGKSHPLETDANALYRLASAGGETFHEIYRIVL